MMHIKIGRRLIEQQNLRLLRQRHGQPRALTFATAQCMHQARTQRSQLSKLQCFFNRQAVLLIEAVEEPAVRQASVAHQLLHRRAAGSIRALRHHRQRARYLFRRHFVDVLAVEINRTARRLQQAA